MKKIILCAVALMFGVVAFAQTPVAPLPGSALGANTGESIQNGNDNKVRVRQAGTSQSVYTNQNDGSGTGGNLAKIRQTGAVSALSGVENNADVWQSGSANQSQTRQEGDYNYASTEQGQNDDSSSGNKAKIRQGVADQAQDNIAEIDQDGDDNLAQTQQTFDNSEAYTDQDGNGNKSMITQNAGPNQSAGHWANVWQLGDDNESAIMQDGANATNFAQAYQAGTGNKAKQFQTTDGATIGDGNWALVGQGFGVSGGPVDYIRNDLQTVDNIQNGSSGPNYYSDNAVAFQIQSGNNNDTETLQYGEDNYSQQVQSGSNNDGFIIQNWFGNPNGGANFASQTQSGTNSVAGLGQNGTGHKAWQRQTDDDNNILSTQRGRDNLLNTYQDGDGNRGTTAQRGRDNTILLVQRGGHSYSVTQNLPNGSPVGSPNGGNQVDVLQLGPSGNFATDGIDCEFEPEMDPTMDYSIPDFELEDVCPDC